MATEIKKIISRRDTAAKWEANNPILAQGEIGVDTTNKVMKIGDGVTPWKSLKGVGGTEIVNDLTTGGADKALSAEMGKELDGKLAEFELEIALGGSSYGVLVSGKGIKKGTLIPELLEYKGKKVSYSVSPVGINGAIAFFDSNGDFITYLLHSGTAVVPVNAEMAIVEYGDINALVLYEPLTNSKLREDVDSALDLVPDVEELNKSVNGNDLLVTDELVFNAQGKYINGENTGGNIYTYSSLSLAYYRVQRGISYHIQIAKAANSAGWNLGYSSVADGTTKLFKVLEQYGKGTNAAANFDVESEYDAYLVVGYATGTAIPVVSHVGHINGLTERVEMLEDESSRTLPHILKGKTIMSFGDSLTAASTTGVIGFMRHISDFVGLPYRGFVRDSADGNTEDAPVDFPSVTNYAKDGTTNAITSGRTDSILERVKRHVLPNSNIDYVLVECSVNDPVVSELPKGEISDSYTADFDTSTTLGAIEETCRYLTNLGKNIKIGFFIPWNIWYIDPTYFDDYKNLFHKWGVPFFDMRFCSGFNFRGSAIHRSLYSLSQASYNQYDSTATYNLDDKVKFGGSLYKCLQDGVTNIPPTNTTYWMLIGEGAYDGCHLNNLGHEVVYGKILDFIQSL